MTQPTLNWDHLHLPHNLSSLASQQVIEKRDMYKDWDNFLKILGSWMTLRFGPGNTSCLLRRFVLLKWEIGNEESGRTNQSPFF